MKSYIYDTETSMSRMVFFGYVILMTSVLHVLTYGQNYKTVVDLRSEVLAGYEKTVRPVLDQADLLHVNISYDIVVITEINERQGIMTVLIQMVYTWIDERIQWNPYLYNNTNTLVLPADSVWKPELVLIASADPERSLDSSMKTVRYYPNGVALWYPMGVISVSCAIDIKFYPFDTQQCPIQFMALDYFPQELKLHAVNKEASLQFYVDNGVWDLVKTDSRAWEDELPMYTVTLTVTRKPTFIIIIVIIPIMLLSFLSIMVFLLPAESGERMSYSITILLALMVFLTIVSDHIPKTSRPLSILSYFIGLHVLLSAFITLATILNLRLYYKDDQELVPYWLAYCCCKHEEHRKYSANYYRKHLDRPNATNVLDPASGKTGAIHVESFYPYRRNANMFRTNAHGGGLDESNLQLHKTFDEHQPRLRTVEKAKPKMTWKDVCKTIDWIMFIISIVYFVVVFIVFALLAAFQN